MSTKYKYTTIFLKIYKNAIPACSLIGFTLGACSTLNWDIPLSRKFIISTGGIISGTFAGIILPVIVPSAILFSPFAIYDIYQKTNYFFIKKNEVYPSKK